MGDFLHSLATGATFNPVSAFLIALFGGAFAIVAIVFKQSYEFRTQRRRNLEMLTAELVDIEEHFARNVERIEAMVSVLQDGDELWPERVHLKKLLWPQDSAFFNKDVTSLMSVDVANNIGKFRLRLRNANLDAEAALRVYETKDAQALAATLEYVRARSLRLIALAPSALRRRAEQEPRPEKPRVNFRDVKDMIFLPARVIFEEGLE